MTSRASAFFGVKIQGTQVIDSLDIFARTGRKQSAGLQLPGNLSQRWLAAHHLRQATGEPGEEIAAIAIEGSVVRKINCGGDAYLDYAADAVDQNANPLRNRTMPVDEFYLDFARANFGSAIAEASRTHSHPHRRDQSAGADRLAEGPGRHQARPHALERRQAALSFVDELAALRPKIEGPGNLERFDYWLNTYRYMATLAEARCLRGELDKAVAAKDFTRALQVRTSLARAWESMIALQIAATDTPGELGTLANLEQHSRRTAAVPDSPRCGDRPGTGRTPP